MLQDLLKKFDFMPELVETPVFKETKEINVHTKSSWKTRDGEIIHIISCRHITNDGCVYFFKGDNGLYYTKSGRIFFVGKSRSDIIEEVIEGV